MRQHTVCHYLCVRASQSVRMCSTARMLRQSELVKQWAARHTRATVVFHMQLSLRRECWAVQSGHSDKDEGSAWQRGACS